MISEAVKVVLGLLETGIHTGESIVYACEIMLWPVENDQKVYVMDCDYSGRPLPVGLLKVWTDWNIGLKIHKEFDCSDDFLLSDEGRKLVLKELLL